MPVISFKHLLFAVFIVVIWPVATVVYNLYLHPLRSFPGPWYARSTIAWFICSAWVGDHWLEVHKLHLKYGPVVRIAPNELSFVEASAWKDIYGHRLGKPEFPKDSSQLFSDDPSHPHIIVAPREKHANLRKLLSHGFSDAALRDQEKVLTKFVTQMIEGLRANVSNPIDMVQWYNFITFDIIGHLTFAESFDCLSESTYHPWIGTIFGSVKFITWGRILQRLVPGYANVLINMIPEKIRREHNSTQRMVKEKLMRRQEKTIDYIDFVTKLLDAEEKDIIDSEDLIANLPVIVIAGSETTATALSGITYYLLKNPRIYTRLVEEIRSHFKTRDEVNMKGANELKYLAAVIEEGLRIYPPANSNHPRVVSPEGAMICGRFIPGSTLVGIPHYACFHSLVNFADPDEFIPERSLHENERYTDDKRDAIQPFHIGPRNCIGRNLAFIEMRLILIHLLLEFDLKSTAENLEAWERQKVFSTWMKKPLMVQLRPR